MSAFTKACFVRFATPVVAIMLATRHLSAVDDLPSTPRTQTSPVQMIFPADAPPLGAVVPRRAQLHPPLSEKERALSGEMLEPYFAPLSTYTIEPWHRLNPKLAALLEDYRSRRAELVRELRDTIADVRLAPPPERLAAFSTLAGAQEPRLVALENAAETLRAKLALETDWNERRQWRLHRRDLISPGSGNAVLGYLVIRAAAFYQSDFTPAQRRLLREAEWQLEDKIFAGESSASRLFQFFSPDLMLVRFPTGIPQSIADDVELHVARKEALRQELCDAIHGTDGALSFARASALRRLAIEQQPRIDALEDLAEKIRRELADYDISWRRSPPAALPRDVEGRLDALLTARQQLEDAYLASIESILSTPPSADVRRDAAALHEWREIFRDRLAKAAVDFQREHAAETEKLEEDLIPLDGALQPHYEQLDDAATPGARVMNFVHRRRVERAYYEYDIAAFEPGLSPRQRTLLFAAAVAALDLALPAAEHQATVQKPQTLLK